MSVHSEHPLNEGLVRYARTKERKSPSEIVPAFVAPSDHPDPYQGALTHPDVVEYLWDRLVPAVGGPLLKGLVYGRPGLVHEPSGVVLARGWGTSYVIRVASEDAVRAETASLLDTHTWSDGRTFRLAEMLGESWRFGGFSPVEPDLLRSFVTRNNLD